MPEVVDEFPIKQTSRVELSDYKRFMDGQVWMFTPNDGREMGITRPDEWLKTYPSYEFTEKDILETLRSRLAGATIKFYGRKKYKSRITVASSEEEITYRLYYQFIGENRFTATATDKSRLTATTKGLVESIVQTAEDGKVSP